MIDFLSRGLSYALSYFKISLIKILHQIKLQYSIKFGILKIYHYWNKKVLGKCREPENRKQHSIAIWKMKQNLKSNILFENIFDNIPYVIFLRFMLYRYFRFIFNAQFGHIVMQFLTVFQFLCYVVQRVNIL